MTNNSPDTPGTPDDGGSSPWEDMLRSMLGSQADEVIRDMKARGIDPTSFAGPDLPSDPQVLGPLLNQVTQMFANASGEAVNPDVAHDVARQAARAQGDPSVVSSQEKSVNDAMKVAELWLDSATQFPPSAATVRALDRSQWVELTLPAWQSLAAPIAQSVADALAKILKDSLPDDLSSQADSVSFQISGVPGMPSPFTGMLGADGLTPEKLMHQIGAAVFGMQVGTAAGTLSREVFGTTDIGVPLTPTPVTALLPTNVEQFAQGLEVPEDEVRLFLALREAAHARLLPTFRGSSRTYTGSFMLMPVVSPLIWMRWKDRCGTSIPATRTPCKKLSVQGCFPSSQQMSKKIPLHGLRQPSHSSKDG